MNSSAKLAGKRYVESSEKDVIFDNLPKLISPKDLADCLGISLATVYDWNYRKQTRGIPSKLFLKLGRKLYVRTDVLNEWLRNSS